MRFFLILGLTLVAIFNSKSALSDSPEDAVAEVLSGSVKETATLHVGVIAVAKTNDFLGDEFKANQTALMQYIEFLDHELNFQIGAKKYTVVWDVTYIDGLTTEHYNPSKSASADPSKSAQIDPGAGPKSKTPDQSAPKLSKASKDDSQEKATPGTQNQSPADSFKSLPYSCSNINDAIDRIKENDTKENGANDKEKENNRIIIFYYSGHGQATQSSDPSPRISCAKSQFEESSPLNSEYDGEERTLDEVMSKLMDKARLTVVIADTCNNVTTELSEITPGPFPKLKPKFFKVVKEMSPTQRMFTGYHGQILIWSADRDECSIYKNHNKGYFTTQFMAGLNISRRLKDSANNWDELVTFATQPIDHPHHPKLQIGDECKQDIQHPVSADKVRGKDLCPPTVNPCPLIRISDAGKKYGYVRREAIWTFPDGKEKVISVCWENPSPEYKERMEWVRDAVHNSWEEASALKFEGWDKACTPSSEGIHIKIGDEKSRNVKDFAPHTEKLGADLNKLPDGMVLNLDFNVWSPDCPKQSLKSCIQSVAVHEFGHALGFAHELERFNTPGECRNAEGRGNLTPYDPKSAMNHCHPGQNNGGKLGDRDIISLQKIYCPKNNAACKPEIRVP